MSVSAMTRMMLAVNEMGTMSRASVMLRNQLPCLTRLRYRIPSASSMNSVRMPAHASATSSWYWPIWRITPARLIG